MFNNHTETEDIISLALRKAFQQGQTYWQQADSESYVENRRSDLTYTKFCSLQEETVIAVSKQIEYMQSQIDELMLEYCPDEMSQEQLDNWAKNQKVVVC